MPGRSHAARSSLRGIRIALTIYCTVRGTVLVYIQSVRIRRLVQLVHAMNCDHNKASNSSSISLRRPTLSLVVVDIMFAWLKLTFVGKFYADPHVYVCRKS